ncbi:MAG: hypothetical protein DRG25_03640, partial [Deltaproteobacteria bacterium]
PHAFSSQLEKNGAVGVNAFTTKDQTQFTASIPSDMLEQWFSIISEQLFEPSWREFYVEKEVVQREWAFRYINNPEGAAWLDLNATAYTAHPYHNPTIGWKSDMEKYSTKDAIEFHQKYYHPNNAVCVLVGDVKVEEVKKLAKIYFGRYPPGMSAPEKVTEEPPQEGPRRSIRFLKGAHTPLVRIGFHAAKMGTRDFYALDGMTMILSQGRYARLAQNIVNKGLALHAWAHNPDNRYGGMVIVGGSPIEPDELKNRDLPEVEKRKVYLKACEELEKILLAEVEKLKTELVPQRELERIRKLNQREFLDRMRSNEDLASTLATLEVQVGWNYFKTYLEKIAEVTPEDIRQVAKKYIRNENKTTIYVIPGGKPDHPPEYYTEIRSVSGSVAARMKKPKEFINNSIYPTPEGWKHPLSFERQPEKIEYPKAEMEKLKGSTVFYLPDRELPLIDLTILVKAGAVDEDDNKLGLTRVLNGCLIQGGTEKYPPSELAMVLDENAIRLSFSALDEETVIRLSVMKSDWEKGLSLLTEILTRPRFDPEVLKATKKQVLTALKRQGGNAMAVARREWMIWHFKGHPYGRDPLEELKTVPKVTRNDLKEFLEKYFVPFNMVVAISGDIEKDLALKGLEKLFHSLPQSQAPGRKIKNPVETPPVLALIHKPGQVQSQIIMGLPGVKRTHPAYWKLSLLMDILGGDESLIYRRLRDDLGLSYATCFYQAFRWKAGMLIGYIGCKGDRTSEAIYETVKIMDSLKKGIPKEDFELKKLEALNSFVFNVDSPSELVETYSHYYLRNEPLDTLERIQNAFIKSKSEELKKLAKEFLDSEILQIYVVGDKNTKVKKKDGTKITLEEDLRVLAKTLNLPYKEIALR